MPKLGDDGHHSTEKLKEISTLEKSLAWLSQAGERMTLKRLLKSEGLTAKEP